MFMWWHNNARQNIYINIAHISFENVAEFKYLTYVWEQRIQLAAWVQYSAYVSMFNAFEFLMRPAQLIEVSCACLLLRTCYGK
jgi:hypothetical protein